MASGTSWSNVLPASDAIYAGTTGGIYFMLEGYCAYSSAYDLGNYHSWDDVQCPPDDSKCENMVKYNVFVTYFGCRNGTSWGIQL